MNCFYSVLGWQSLQLLITTSDWDSQFLWDLFQQNKQGNIDISIYGIWQTALSRATYIDQPTNDLTTATESRYNTFWEAGWTMCAVLP